MKTHAANTCSGKTLTPALPGYDYKKENKDLIKSSMILQPQISATADIKNNVNIVINITYDATHLKNQDNTFWVPYDKTLFNGTAHAYIQYKATAQLQHLVDNQAVETYSLNLSQPTQANHIIVNKTYNVDDKGHSFKVIFTYSPSGQYCETNDWEFNGEPGSWINKTAFSKEATSNVIYFQAGECNKLRGEIEGEICNSINCMREVYQDEKLWVNNRPGTFDQLMTDMTTGGFVITDLTTDGYAKLQKCKQLNTDLDNSINNYKKLGCKDNIVWKQDCKFSQAGGDVVLTAEGDINKANSLAWIQNKLTKVAQKISEMPSITPANSSPCVAKFCTGNKQIGNDPVWGYVCQGMCMVSDAFMSWVRWSFSILGAALSTESEKGKTVEQVQTQILKIPSNTDSSSTGTSGTGGTNTSGVTGSATAGGGTEGTASGGTGAFGGLEGSAAGTATGGITSGSIISDPVQGY